MNDYNFLAEKPISEYQQKDRVFLVLVLLLWGMGILTLVVCTPTAAQRLFNDPYHFVKRQLIASLVGMIGFGIFSSVSMKTIRKYLPLFVLACIFFCFLTLIPGIGVEKKGATRWVKIPFLSSFQPSELVKLAMVLFLANYFDKQEKIVNPSERTIFPAVVVFLFFIALIFMQKDLSSSFFVFSVGILMFFVCGAKLLWVIPLTILGIPAGFLMVVMEQYRVNRLIAFLKPSEDLQGINFQSFAARRAINAGGFWGQGNGSGLTKLTGIPEVQTDYIFAGWAESTGLFGVIIYFCILIFFVSRAYKIAFTCKNRFAAIGAFGCTTAIFIQSLLNCAVVGGVIPNTGITLPFFSSGGSSIVVTLVMCGFIFNASRQDLESDLITESLHGVEVYE